jgi:small ligand-binding sensory domain FIST
MEWASAASTAPIFATALEEAADGIEEALGSAQPDLAFAFVSSHHRESFVRLARAFTDRFPRTTLVGCSGGGVIGGGREIEQVPGFAVLAAVLPNVTVSAVHLDAEDMPDPRAPSAAWCDRLGIANDASPSLVLLPDPFTCPVGGLIGALDRAFPEAAKIGGIASGGTMPGQTVLYAGQSCYGTGAVVLALQGNLVLDTLVAQGCRPIGMPLFVTRCERNVIQELDGRSPSAVVQELYDSLGERDRALMRSSLFLGIVMEEHKEIYSQGDFLVRNIVGLDAQTGAMALAAEVPKNGVVQFHLRDAETSADDLAALLFRYNSERDPPAGALLFSCLGRGQHLYGRPDHDSSALRTLVGPVPIGGFFCNGEIGPVQGRTYLHGYTSAFAMFRREHAD